MTDTRRKHLWTNVPITTLLDILCEQKCHLKRHFARKRKNFLFNEKSAKHLCKILEKFRTNEILRREESENVTWKKAKFLVVPTQRDRSSFRYWQQISIFHFEEHFYGDLISPPIFLG